MASGVGRSASVLRAFVSNFSLRTLSNEHFLSGLRCVSCLHKRGYSTPAPTVRAQYGGRHTVTLMAGDGVGPELMGHVKQVFRYAGVPVDFEEIRLDREHNDSEAFRQALLAVKRNGTALKGSVETGIDSPTGSLNAQLRTELDLFASVIKVQSIPGVQTRHDNIDVVIIRENTEGEYSNLEHENVPGVVESLKIITAAKSTRIARYAFNYAVEHGRKKVTAVHKANIMKLGDGLFLECCRKVSEEFPQIEFESMIIDNCSMQMVSRPQQFDVMVLPNLYGNIVGNIAAGLTGGQGVVPGMNIGENYAIFESGTRNSGRSIAGKDIANPAAMLLASADLLEHIGLKSHSELIRDAVIKVIVEDKIHTPDLGGQATTVQVVQAVIGHVREKTKQWYSHVH
ncbi:isocitrate dehydrogenase [NAD] subunit gamma, mitochondrial isoform X1 [Lingula anatina]|uniref:Isocitrate dehydrogenase [NAD] subunit gamma, mitochondrial isoform X1 n=3 Tax=Lingula anatina TaxID=7574 RepID=A0A1S3J4K2_LINAN|nr:isocitrate dehydrogenase [NAD] subunit gamma, mitochondrial isoform X1 [Lingula anatina]|eukprot:XP_013404769.1 isocitrate dehydrogenase [NAD] subunit gamma, mitochondrial isoform X1 [Lingula anatina]